MDANTNANKVAVWQDLHNSFNNMAKIPRTLQQLKAQWGIIKITAKKQKFLERKQTFQTGGGPPTVSEPTSGDDIAVWLPHEFTVDTIKYDSDNQNIPEIIIENEEAIPQVIGIDLDPIPPLPHDNSQLKITEVMLEPTTFAQSDQQCKMDKTTPKCVIPNYRSKNKRFSKENAVIKIAEMEIACRRELHEVQMAHEKQKLANEIQKSINLRLEEQVLKQK